MLNVHFILMDPNPRNDSTQCDEWRKAIKEILPRTLEANFTVIDTKGKLHDTILTGSLGCDCLVSPGNSFGIMDGEWDRVLSGYLQDKEHGILTMTRCAQAALRERWHGYAPPGSATLTALPPTLSGVQNVFGAMSLAIVPALRFPEDSRWNLDLVYHAMWSLLVEIERWNSSEDTAAWMRVETVMMTGLGTWVGKVSTRRCARQMVLAFKHFMEGPIVEANWEKVMKRVEEIEDARGL